MVKFRYTKDGGATWTDLDEDLPFNIAGVLASDTVIVEPVGATATLYGNVAAFLGHSFIAMSLVTTGGTLDRAIRGWPNWVSAFSGGRLIVPRSHLLGQSGADQPTVYANIGTALALEPKPGFVFLDTGANDYIKSDGTRPTVSAFLAADEAACVAILDDGVMPVIKTIKQRDVGADGVNPPTEAMETWRQDVNEGRRSLATELGIRLVDGSETFTDEFGNWLTNRTYDYIHNDGPGALIDGLNGWNAVSDLVVAEPYVIPPAGNLLTNSEFADTGGSKNGTVTGSVPTGWIGTQNGSSGTGVTLSIVPATDGGSDWLQAVIVAGAGGRGGFELRQSLSSVTTVGDDVAAGYDLEIEGAEDSISQLSCEIRTFGVVVRSTHLAAVEFGQILNDDGPALYRLRMETYPFTLPSGVTGSALYINATALAGQTVTMRIRNPWTTKE